MSERCPAAVLPATSTPAAASLAALRAARIAECDPFVLEELTGALA
jgi:hypothetical protein